jgi:hypothetical protein
MLIVAGSSALIAKRRGKISVLAPYVRKLHQSSIFYGDDLLEKVLKLAGEWNDGANTSCKYAMSEKVAATSYFSQSAYGYTGEYIFRWIFQ